VISRSFVRQINLDKPFLDHFRDEHDILMRQCGIGAAGDEDRGFSTLAVIGVATGMLIVGGAIGYGYARSYPKASLADARSEIEPTPKPKATNGNGGFYNEGFSVGPRFRSRAEAKYALDHNWAMTREDQEQAEHLVYGDGERP
jgi:hypothetical protein